MSKQEALKRYGKNRNKHTEYVEQVLGKKKMKEMGKLWKKHGADLDYIREILEYNYILDFYPDKEQAQLIADILAIENDFLKDCCHKYLLGVEEEKAKELSENNF